MLLILNVFKAAVLSKIKWNGHMAAVLVYYILHTQKITAFWLLHKLASGKNAVCGWGPKYFTDCLGYRLTNHTFDFLNYLLMRTQEGSVIISLNDMLLSHFYIILDQN